MIAVEAEMWEVDAFDRLGGNSGVMRVDLASRSRLALERSVPIDVVRIPVVPRLHVVVAGVALEDRGLRHAVVLLRSVLMDALASKHPGEDSNFRPAD